MLKGEGSRLDFQPEKPQFANLSIDDGANNARTNVGLVS